MSPSLWMIPLFSAKRLQWTGNEWLTGGSGRIVCLPDAEFSLAVPSHLIRLVWLLFSRIFKEFFFSYSALVTLLKLYMIREGSSRERCNSAASSK